MVYHIYLLPSRNLNCISSKKSQDYYFLEHDAIISWKLPTFRRNLPHFPEEINIHMHFRENLNSHIINVKLFKMQDTLGRFYRVLTMIYYLLTYLCTELSPSWEAANCAAIQEIPSNFKEPERSSPYSQGPSTGPYPEPVRSSPHHPILSL
jgi:hypothetical protein